jgi:hypothetical protein
MQGIRTLDAALLAMGEEGVIFSWTTATSYLMLAPPNSAKQFHPPPGHHRTTVGR